MRRFAILSMLLLASIGKAAEEEPQLRLANPSLSGVMLEGHDPVALCQNGGLVGGSKKFQARFEGGTYYFMSEANRETFNKAPARFAPKFGGFCAVSASMGMLEPADIRTATVHEGRIYVQRNAKALTMWKKDMLGIAARAEKQWPALLLRYASTLSADQVDASGELTLGAARTILAAARAFAKKHRAPGGSIAIVDSGGHLICMERLDGTFPASALVAFEKARTAAVFRFPSRKLEDAIVGGRTSLNTVGFTMLRGGIPLRFRGQVVGAIGVSGAASAKQDEEIAIAGSQAHFKDEPK